MLTSNEREYVKNPKKRDRYLKTTRRQYDYRIREKAKQMIKDLEFLATHQDESQQKQIFTEDIFLPMIKAVVNPNRPGIARELQKKKKKSRSKRIYVTDERGFSLSNKLIEIATSAGSKLVPPDIANLFLGPKSYMEETRMVLTIGRSIGE